MLPDSMDPSLTLHMKGFDGFHVTGMFRMHMAGLTEPVFDKHEL